MTILSKALHTSVSKSNPYEEDFQSTLASVGMPEKYFLN